MQIVVTDTSYMIDLWKHSLNRPDKDVAEKAQIDVTGISGHSFRVGTAQTLVKKKATMPQLQTVGRWKDTRMPARYTEKEELAHGIIATILGK